MFQINQHDLQFDSVVVKLYSQYVELYPLNISRNNTDIYSWRVNNMFGILDFAHIVQVLLKAKKLDDFVKDSKADFDNLAMLVKVVVENGLISINRKGVIKDRGLLKETKVLHSRIVKFAPNNLYNQFPCDENSRLRRANLIINRYPFTKYVRFAIIGEDDFLSPMFSGLLSFHPVVLEKDEMVIKKLIESDKSAKIYTLDVVDEEAFYDLSLPSVCTFITDPPYTLHGALAFIYRGLSMLSKNDDIKEFYVILNPTMMGKHFATICTLLAQSQVYLYETKDNFSQYELPANFKERTRANTFLRQMNIDSGTVSYSSSSSLYIFRTVHPNLKKIKRFINFEKIYTHFI